MWDLPRPGLEPVSPALAGRLSTTAPPGKSPHITFLKPGIWGQSFWKRAGGPVQLDMLRTRNAAVKLCGQGSSFEGMESALRATRPGSRALSWVTRDAEVEGQDWGSAEG